jgi:HEAT repeat protein
VELAGTAGVFANNTVWRATGSRAAGRRLVRALAAEDETVRTLAGMFLVQGGKRAEPLLREALGRRESLPLVLTILGDLGDPALTPDLRRFSQDTDPQVAQAARDALRVLDVHRQTAH